MMAGRKVSATLACIGAFLGSSTLPNLAGCGKQDELTGVKSLTIEGRESIYLAKMPSNPSKEGPLNQIHKRARDFEARNTSSSTFESGEIILTSGISCVVDKSTNLRHPKLALGESPVSQYGWETLEFVDFHRQIAIGGMAGLKYVLNSSGAPETYGYSEIRKDGINVWGIDSGQKVLLGKTDFPD